MITPSLTSFLTLTLTGTSYVPLMAGMKTSPDCLLYGWQGMYNLSTSFWAHRVVINVAQIKFSYMIEDIRAAQSELEGASQQLVDEISEKFASRADDDGVMRQV